MKWIEPSSSSPPSSTLSLSKRRESADAFEATRASLNPNSQAVKSLEMSVKRTRCLYSIYLKHIDVWGVRSREVRPCPGEQEGNRSDWDTAFGPRWWLDPAWLEWGTVYDWISSGAPARVEAAIIDQLPDLNRKRLEKKT